MGAASEVEAQVAMQKLQRVWEHVVVTGSWSRSWQIGQRSSSCISSSSIGEPAVPSGWSVELFVAALLAWAWKERCARRAARWARPSFGSIDVEAVGYFERWSISLGTRTCRGKNLEQETGRLENRFADAVKNGILKQNIN
jgi:hypothetical protein